MKVFFRFRPATICSPPTSTSQLIHYWDFDYPRADPKAALRSDADYVAEFRFALEEAVRLLCVPMFP